MLFLKSGYFQKLLLGDNKVSSSADAYQTIANLLKEAREAKVKLDDVPPCLLARFINSCYDPQAYPESVEPSNYVCAPSQVTWQDDYKDAAHDNFVAAQLAIRVFELSERLDAYELKSKARLAFLRAWTNADKKSHSDLTPEDSSFSNENCKNEKAFALLIRDVYSTTHSSNRGLRDIVFRTMKWHTFYYDGFKEDSQFIRQIVEDNPDVALDLALHTISAPIYACEECSNWERLVLYPCTCEKQSTHCTQSACVSVRRLRAFCLECHSLSSFDSAVIQGPEDCDLDRNWI